ncbi:hypothetical protein P154DRAFT_518921 [Amniculicola lignicola CBS 123094]|uniref:Uncharacterized protein n=1 Tax=Amniculicola lignicola CBS 123094 TaxID=1392246 RepID=A0A6A5WXI1_9PLEO|nr:hypothetical protein P154DRAFT_518921 [Amniculicola lignicola CBS 123094]
MTRRQLAKQEEQLSKSQRMPSPPPQVQPAPKEITEEAPVATKETEPAQEETIYEDAVAGAEDEPQQQIQAKEPECFVLEGADEPDFIGEPGPTIEEDVDTPYEQEIITPSVEVDEPSPEPKSLSSYTPRDEQLTPSTSRAPSRAPSKSPSRSPMRLEESIEAIDALEEALENVGKAIPRLDNSGDEKSPRKTRFDLTATPNTRAKAAALKKSPLAAVPKLSRVPGTIRSLKPPTTKPVPTKASLSRSQSVRVAPSKNVEVKERKGSGQVADYLASKRRPISMSFPTPPPPAKSTRPPTKSTFQLPGEAVALRLKAAREERLKREAEEKERKEKEKEKEKELMKKPTFKARPAPVQKTAPPPIRQTAASKARENLMNSKPTAEEKEKEKEKENKPTSTASKRMSSLNPTKQRPSSMFIPSHPTFSITSSSTTSKRSSMIMNPGPVSKSTVTPADAVAQRHKAREIFNRDKQEKEAREKERREKEDAAKRARAEAAERGRIASREWAEKQRRKMLAVVAAVAEMNTSEAA